LLELKIGCSPALILPTRCRWPPGLQKLFVRSIKFSAPSVGLLPDSLQYFGVKFSDGCEDEEVYPFSNFDISSLPRGLKHLEVIHNCHDTVRIIGTVPPLMHTVLTDDATAVDRHLFPVTCNFDGESDEWNTGF
jgi:hypothetical protein